ncbi:MFS transporter [Azospirillum sp. B4]|uniref:MFS transporter n=1 Tax=Azospirillum sp. B4 TaxID=95605 RepID=UPI0005CA4774|nr:MFS transporter [Azospirillum sp. B4]
MNIGATRTGNGAAVQARWGRIAAWCLYDWATAPFHTLVATFVFSVYFTKAVVGDPVRGAALWGSAMGAAGIVIAVASPVLGAIADSSGRRKPWIAGFTTLVVLATATLWRVAPTPASIPLALGAAALGAVATELAHVFYNALLPAVAPSRLLGRVSGWGWGSGYASGLIVLLLALALLIKTDHPLFGLLGTDAQQGVRASNLLVALWMALFVLPLFRWVPDRADKGLAPGAAVRQGLSTLAATVRGLPRRPDILRFLVASALWRDGIATLVQFGGIFAATEFGMEPGQIILFAIILNVSAGLGAAVMAWADDRFGAKRVLVISLLGLILSGGGMVLVGTRAGGFLPPLGLPIPFSGDQQWLLLLGLGLGACFGPAQAAARSLMARLSPPGLEAEMFGLYALSGRAVSALGPLAYGAATAAFASQRAGMATVLALFLAGLALLLPLREQRV